MAEFRAMKTTSEMIIRAHEVSVQNECTGSIESATFKGNRTKVQALAFTNPSVSTLHVTKPFLTLLTTYFNKALQKKQLLMPVLMTLEHVNRHLALSA